MMDGIRHAVGLSLNGDGTVLYAVEADEVAVGEVDLARLVEIAVILAVAAFLGLHRIGQWSDEGAPWAVVLEPIAHVLRLFATAALSDVVGRVAVQTKADGSLEARWEGLDEVAVEVIDIDRLGLLVDAAVMTAIAPVFEHLGLAGGGTAAEGLRMAVELGAGLAGYGWYVKLGAHSLFFWKFHEGHPKGFAPLVSKKRLFLCQCKNGLEF